METHHSLNENQKIVIKIDPELAELIPAFLKNRESDIRGLNESLAKSDYVIIERLGHGMKGAGAGFGFDEITEIGALIEKAAKEKKSDEIQKGIEKLTNYMKLLEVTYE